jgi:BirA family transcriptional regulator, biotin operon repressor / biotin---[acetyl-CoA-carboxylase] ligase
VASRELYEELPSTQARALELARGGAEEGSVVVARRQSGGRGRGDRRWESPAGGLYLSVVLRPATAPPLLPLAIGSELAGALVETFGVRLRFKWPNDLLSVDGAGKARKLAGILVDLVRSADRGTAAVAGIGVNAQRLDSGVSPEVRATSVALEELTREPVELDRLEGVVARSVIGARRALSEAAGDREVLARVRGLLYGVGEAVTVDGAPVGVLVGVRDDGSLEVAGPAGTEALLAGDVRVGVGS